MKIPYHINYQSLLEVWDERFIPESIKFVHAAPVTEYVYKFYTFIKMWSFVENLQRWWTTEPGSYNEEDGGHLWSPGEVRDTHVLF